jgi:plastocyanin
MRILLLIALFATFPAYATTFIVNVGGTNLAFSPQTVTINPGDTVTFVNRGGDHNAQSDDNGKTFRCARGCDGDGMGGNGAPSNSNWTASVTFNTPGTIGYFCEIHGAPNMGMYGTIVVQGSTQAAPTPVPGSSGLQFDILLALALMLVAASLIRPRN